MNMINELTDMKYKIPEIDNKKDTDIAIVGISCRFPGAKDYKKFWENLRSGTNSIKEITPDRWDIEEYYSQNYNEPGKSISKWCGLIENVDMFDARFFNISPREANYMDPQQRLLLEETWRCIEDSGIQLKELQNGKTSVFVGVMTSDYMQIGMNPSVETGSFSCLGSYETILANRISYVFNFSGKSMPVNAACASSLVAIHEAKKSLLCGESDFAIVAAVNLNLHPWKYVSFTKSRMLSPDGQCKTFDKDANGYVPGDGVGVILLKRHVDTSGKSDNVYALIKGTGINHGGKSLSITSPSVEAQMDVIRSAYEDAGINPETVTYVEAHGTGTSLGDPIEVEALTKAFSLYTNKKQYCKIGSVKSNIGHLEGAAGIAGIIKVVMMMKYRQIPSSLNIKTLNPIIHFQDTPFMVSTELADWKASCINTPLRAGISSFGFGGVNTHVLLEEFVEDNTKKYTELEEQESTPYMFCLSTKSQESLKELIESWKAYVHGDEFELNKLKDISYTLLTGREHFNYRFGMMVNTLKDVKEGIVQYNRCAENGMEEKPWCIRIVELLESQTMEARNFIEHYPLLKLKDEEVIQSLERQGINGQVLTLLKDNLWSNERKDVSRFFVSYILLQSLNEIGIKHDTVEAYGKGFLLGLTYCGILDLKDALEVVFGCRNLGTVHLKRPGIPFYDCTQQKVFKPYKFSVDYLKALINNYDFNLSISGQDKLNPDVNSSVEQFVIQNGEDWILSYYIDKAKLLSENQYTFKKFLEEWDEVINKWTGKDIYCRFNDETLMGLPNAHAKRERILVLIAIIDSLRKLNKKWSLAEKRLINDDRFYELLDLISDDILTKDMLVELLTSEKADEAELVELLNKGVNKLDLTRSYSLLRQYCKELDEVSDMSSWLSQIQGIDQIEVYDKEFNYITFGEKSLEDQRVVNVGIDKMAEKPFLDLLLKLWLHRMDLDMGKLFKGKPFKTARLPLYTFDCKPYGLSKSKSSVAPKATVEKPKDLSLSIDYLMPAWLPSDRFVEGETKTKKICILLSREDSLSGALYNLIKHNYEHVYVVSKNITSLTGEKGLVIADIENEDCFSSLIDEIKDKIVGSSLDVYYLWSYDADPVEINSVNQIQELMDSGIRGLFNLAKAFAPHQRRMEMNWIIPTRDSYVVVDGDKGNGYCHGSISGFIRTLALEFRNLSIKQIDFGMNFSGDNEKAGILFQEACAKRETGLIAYRNNQRLIYSYTANHNLEKGSCDFNNHPLVIVVGGTGGIGLKLVEELYVNKGCRIVILGRSELKEEAGKWLESIRNKDNELVYFRCDVSDFDALQKILQQIEDNYGNIDGVIHSGGTVDDRLIGNKNWASFEKVLSSKVYGIWNLNHLTRKHPLKFFIAFSSVVSVLGNLGQADYAAANSFLDAFVNYRSTHGYPGKSLAINWTLWEDGGMGLQQSVKEAFIKKAGIISSRSALADFERMVNSNTNNLIVVGDVEAFDKSFYITNMVKYTDDVTSHNIEPENHLDKVSHHEVLAGSSIQTPQTMNVQVDIKSEVQNILIEILANTLYVDRRDIDAKSDIGEFGMDSVILTEFAEKISGETGADINSTLFYQYRSLDEVSEYLIKNYSGQIRKKININANDNCLEGQAIEEVADKKVHAYEAMTENAYQPYISVVNRQTSRDIAVIGMSGRFPGAESIEEFWDNTIQNKDLITEIPKDRWDWKEIYGDPNEDHNTTLVNAGGFLKNIRRFDAEFFNITPREAELMDPQQRIVLEEVWHALEDAGYKPTALSGTDTGMFIGCTTDDYSDLMARSNSVMEAYTITGTDISILPNRISYFLDIHGPSMLFNTACSSALVAVHHALASLRNGDCSIALVGGVNIICSPKRFILLNKAGMISLDGKCKSFDKSADGYGRAEGVGVLVLKPLDKALKDGDHVYGIIKGSAVNHGGYANSLTSPNTNLQAQVIVKAYQDAGVSPDTVGYIEAHGTGTTIGDPIEVNALKTAFEALYQVFNKEMSNYNYCGIGTVKTNIGSTEAASGIAGIIKVLQSMKNGMLPANINFNELNPYIKLEKSPFYIVDKNTNWDRRPWEEVGHCPRRAGVSAFGFGGVNAHVVLEEYIEKQDVPKYESNSPKVILISAKNRERLKEYVKEIYQYLISSDNSIDDISYTLLSSREEMEERLALIVNDLEELKSKLTMYLAGKTADKVYTGHIRDHVKTRKMFEGPEGDMYINQLIQNRRLEKICQLWSEGVNIGFEFLYKGLKPKKVSLPKYPFAESEYWIPLSTNVSFNPIKTSSCESVLESNNTSNHIYEYVKIINGNEFFIKDHVIRNNKILPGAAYLEIVRETAGTVLKKNPGRLLNLMWINPLEVHQEPVSLKINLERNKHVLKFEISSSQMNCPPVIHCEGSIETEQDPGYELLTNVSRNLSRIKERCSQRLSSNFVYKAFENMKMQYGPSFQTISEIWVGEKECMATIHLPEGLEYDPAKWVMHPNVLDGAFQAAYFTQSNLEDSLYLPFSIESIYCLKPLKMECYAHAISLQKENAGGLKKFDIEIFNSKGELLAVVMGFTLKKVKGESDLKSEILDALYRLRYGNSDINEVMGLINKKIRVI